QGLSRAVDHGPRLTLVAAGVRAVGYRRQDRDRLRVHAARHIGVGQPGAAVEGLRRQGAGDLKGGDVVIRRIARLAVSYVVQTQIDTEIQWLGVHRPGQIGGGLTAKLIGVVYRLRRVGLVQQRQGGDTQDLGVARVGVEARRQSRQRD